MSWIVYPTQIIAPGLYKIPYSSSLPAFTSYYRNFFLRGKGADAGFFCYRVKSASPTAYHFVVSEQISFSFKLNDSIILHRQPGLVNGGSWYSGGLYNLYYDIIYGYILVSNSFAPGTIPLEYFDDGMWKGDDFWMGSLPNSEGDDKTFQPRGNQRDRGTTHVLSYYWPRWFMAGNNINTVAGVYSPVEGYGLSGTKIVGSPYWTSNTGELYYKSLTEKDKTTFYFGYERDTPIRPPKFKLVNNYIRDVSTNSEPNRWLLTRRQDFFDNGDYYGPEPSKDSPTTYESKNKPPITLTFTGYTLGFDTRVAWMAEIGVMRNHGMV
jgi:hypothetical protein